MLAVRSARAPEFYRGARRPAGTRCQQPDRIARDPTTSSAPDEDRALDAVIVAICRSVQEPLESQWASAVIAASFEPHIDVANFKAPRRITPLESLPERRPLDVSLGRRGRRGRCACREWSCAACVLGEPGTELFLTRS